MSIEKNAFLLVYMHINTTKKKATGQSAYFPVDDYLQGRAYVCICFYWIQTKLYQVHIAS
jgi:hypothetical protein